MGEGRWKGCGRRGFVVLGSALAASVLAAIPLLGMRVDLAFAGYLPEASVHAAAAAEEERLFGSSLMLMAGFPAEAQARSAASILGGLPGIRVVGPEAPDASLRGLFEGSAGERALYIVDEGRYRGHGELFRAVESRLREAGLRGVRYWGEPYLQELQLRSSFRDLRFLVPLAAALVLGAHFVATRRPDLALALSAVSFLPALWATGLYARLGYAFKTETILLPVQVMAIGTSYAIQYFRHVTYRVEPAARSRVSSIIGLSALTTVGGFATFLTVPIEGMRRLALSLVFGVGCSALASLLLLPSLLAICPSFPRFETKAVKSDLFRRAAPVAALVLSLLGALAAIGARSFGDRAVDLGYFRLAPDYQASESFFSAAFGGASEIRATIRGDTDFYFLEPARFEALRSLEADLGGRTGVSFALGPARLVDAAFARLYPDLGRPDSIEEIGETVELASGRAGSFTLGALLAEDSRTARVILRMSAEGAEGLEALAREIGEAVARTMPGARLSLTGVPLARSEGNRFFAKAVLGSLPLFFLGLFILLAVRFRSPGAALLGCLPPAAAVLSYAGLSGWAGYALSPILVLGLGAAAGVGVDDGLHLLGNARALERAGRPRGRAYDESVEMSGISIVQTTAVLLVGLSATAASAFPEVARTGLATSLSLAVATACTLFLLPALASRSRPARRG